METLTLICFVIIIYLVNKMREMEIKHNSGASSSNLKGEISRRNSSKDSNSDTNTQKELIEALKNMNERLKENNRNISENNKNIETLLRERNKKEVATVGPHNNTYVNVKVQINVMPVPGLFGLPSIKPF